MFVALAVMSSLSSGLCAFADDDPADARSVHLWWHPDAISHAFYNEVKVTRATNGTYICVCAFSAGYMGLQQKADGSKVVIFSVWDPDDGAKATPKEKQVEVVYCDPAVKTERFGGEGTGQQSFYDFPWEVGTTYKFLVRARMMGSRTAYVAFVFEPRTNQWKHLATFATRPNQNLLNGLYSFVEDFRRDHKSAREAHSARFSNGWILGGDGKWKALDSATFTATDTKQTNIDSFVAGPEFALATGGPVQNKHAHVNDQIATKAHDRTPPPLDNVHAGPQTETAH
jgi:hypothetical protein